MLVLLLRMLAMHAGCNMATRRSRTAVSCLEQLGGTVRAAVAAAHGAAAARARAHQEERSVQLLSTVVHHTLS